MLGWSVTQFYRPGGPLSKRAERRSLLVPWLLLVICVTLVATGVTVGWRPALYAARVYVDGTNSTVPPGFFEAVPTDPAAPRLAEPVLQPRPRVEKPSAAVVGRRLSQIPRAGLGSVGMVFLDAASGAVIHKEREAVLLTPASNMKVLSTLVALAVLGPGTTFETTVVRTAPDRIVLVGGGDPFLTSEPRAYPQGTSLQALARQAAAALKQSGRTTVRLGYDTSLFTGPAWHPDWTDSYRTEVSPITSLWVERGRNPDGVRQPNPPAVAAQAFSAELAKQGIRVLGVEPIRAPIGAPEIAAGASPSVAVIAQEILLHSDNDAAEVLARHTAAATGNPASFAGVAVALSQELRRLGLWQDGAVVADGSGLSKRSRVSTVMLAQALRLALRQPRFDHVIAGLPLAGGSGTLRDRYGPDFAGRGYVWAKTGFLAGIHGLSGLLVTRDGSVVVFAMLINGPAGRAVAQPALDKLASAVVACGCKG